jgi:hypothetical protein
MPIYPYHVSTDRSDPFPSVDNLPTFEADDPMAAVAKLARDGKRPTTGPTFWMRVVTAVHPNGVPHKAISVPLTPEFRVPLDWQPPEATGERF